MKRTVFSTIIVTFVLWAFPLLAQDKADDRVAAAKAAVALAQKTAGEDDLGVAAALIGLGDAYAGGYIYGAQADLAYQHALSIYQKLLPGDDKRIADVLVRLANVSQIEHRAAELLLQRALAIYNKQPASSEDAIQARYSLARQLFAQRRYKEAEPLVIESVQYYRKTHSRNFVFALQLYADVLVASGRLTESKDVMNEFEVEREKALRP